MKNNLARMTELYRTMVRIRAFEDAAQAAARAGKVVGAVHSSAGQEAVAVGVCANLRIDDVLTSTHRGHGHTIAKGADAGAMMAELFGRSTGTNGGKGGSLHIADFSVGMLGANGVVAAGLPIAVGAAQGLRLKGSEALAVTFFGDGATNRGPFLEALNWAASFALPVLFVCEDNGFSAMTRTASVTGGSGPAARAEAIGVRAVTIDGNDLMAVDHTAGELIAEIRAGGGPRFLHCRTYRLRGHTATDPARYREEAEVAAHELVEPLTLARIKLIELGAAARDLDAIEAEEFALIERAVAAAEVAAPPDPSAAYADVQDLGAPPARGAL
ncbi:MAG TPA: thiamine pyrophosphate-dependent dehydrogenase E1 component subunit alpha [Stellaceae bacterium]|nr:thiamine pyrophosphate-dependent dehydrogenase E1 component subunit alpha [Stellaceae bacterium]